MRHAHLLHVQCACGCTCGLTCTFTCAAHVNVCRLCSVSDCTFGAAHPPGRTIVVIRVDVVYGVDACSGRVRPTGHAGCRALPPLCPRGFLLPVFEHRRIVPNCAIVCGRRTHVVRKAPVRHQGCCSSGLALSTALRRAGMMRGCGMGGWHRPSLECSPHATHPEIWCGCTGCACGIRMRGVAARSRLAG